MICEKLIGGQDIRCNTFFRKYYQQVILFNRSDLLEFQKLDTYTDITDVTHRRHAIRFRLAPGATGYLFASSDKGESVTASFTKQVKEGIPQYSHKVTVPLMGVSEEVKCILKEIDNSDLIAAVKYLDNTIEIYGFDFGLVSDYGYEPQANAGGAVIELNSDSLEDDPPRVYLSGTGGDPLEDWDNLFSNNPALPAGDFNDDFNNDYHI